MNSLRWLAQATNGAAPTGAARKANVSVATMSRQMNRGELSPEVVVAIARAYDAPVLPGLVACGLITEEEARTVAPLGKLLSETTNKELLLELVRRVEHGEDDGTLTTPVDIPVPESPTNIRPLPRRPLTAADFTPEEMAALDAPGTIYDDNALEFDTP